MRTKKQKIDAGKLLFSNHDLKVLLIPLMVEQLLNSLMGTVDSMMDGISFRYTEETGIVFSALDFYVKNLIRRLMSCYGVSLKPIINEFK